MTDTDFEPERRSIFLRGAVFLANAFLIVFAIESVFGTLDSAALHLSADSPIFVAYVFVAVLLLVLALITIALLVFVPHLPKIVLLPPLAVLAWQLIGSPPFPWTEGDPASQVPSNAVALGVALLSFLLCKLTTGGWLISAQNLPYKTGLVVRTLIALPVFGGVMLFTLGGLAIGLLVSLIEVETKDYVHFTWTGVEVRETVLRRDDKVVHLVAMVHFAEPRFYRELYASMPPGSLILAEGITDDKGVLTNGLRYNNAARALGLETQDVFQRLLQEQARPVKSEGSVPSSKSDGRTQPPPPPAAPPAPTGPDVVRADVDASDFSPSTIRFLQRVGDVYASANFNEAYEKLSKLGNEFTEEEIDQFWEDIIQLRNTRVLSELDKQLPKYQVIFIPWGAQHMPDLEAGLLDRGFKIETTRQISLASYDTIFRGLSRRAQ